MIIWSYQECGTGSGSSYAAVENSLWQLTSFFQKHVCLTVSVCIEFKQVSHHFFLSFWKSSKSNSKVFLSLMKHWERWSEVKSVVKLVLITVCFLPHTVDAHPLSFCVCVTVFSVLLTERKRQRPRKCRSTGRSECELNPSVTVCLLQSDSPK